ncbi:MAG: hypothetical protein F6K04_01415 [Leptolyngbya sp. SIO4C5]|nr:hypothetical protein [Leptolyngbya sp. SIO4C5]
MEGQELQPSEPSPVPLPSLEQLPVFDISLTAALVVYVFRHLWASQTRSQHHDNELLSGLISGLQKTNEELVRTNSALVQGLTALQQELQAIRQALWGAFKDGDR